MLFHVTFTPKAGYTHEDQKRTLALWSDYQPPEGFEIKSFHVAPDARGFLIVEAETIEALYEAPALWSRVLLDYDIVPVLEVDKSVEILSKVVADREAK